MPTWWETLTIWIQTLPAFWVLCLLALFAILHPLIENPAGILMFTFLTTYWQSPGTAFLYLYSFHLLGLALFYRLIHHTFLPFSRWLITRYPLTQSVLDWIKNQPAWKHILVISMPLVYTYPLRIGWTKNHRSFTRYMVQAAVIYGLFYVGNVLLYIGFLNVLEGIIPVWMFVIILTVTAILIYRIKPKFYPRDVE